VESSQTRLFRGPRARPSDGILGVVFSSATTAAMEIVSAPRALVLDDEVRSQLILRLLVDVRSSRRKKESCALK